MNQTDMNSSLLMAEDLVFLPGLKTIERFQCKLDFSHIHHKAEQFFWKQTLC